MNNEDGYEETLKDSGDGALLHVSQGAFALVKAQQRPARVEIAIGSSLMSAARLPA